MIIDNPRNQHEYLPYTLCAYHTSIRISIGAIPFSLVYSAKGVITLELEISSLRAQLQGLILDEDAQQAHLEHLTLLDEKHFNAIQHHKLYQKHLKHVYGKRVYPKEFKIGDFVLKENQRQSHLEQPLRDKFALNWLGPYIIKNKFGIGAYHLPYLEGWEELQPINIIHLHPFYAQSFSLLSLFIHT